MGLERLTPLSLQLERASQERIEEKWKALEKREKKEAKKGGPDFVPAAERPEATFVASLVDNFVEVISHTITRLHIAVNL